MERLAAALGLVVRQKKEPVEIVTGFEQRNRYAVTDPVAGELYTAVEAGGSTLVRLFLQNLRPFQLQILDPSGKTVLRMERPFRWYFHELRVVDAHARPLGSVRREFSWLRRVYSVRDVGGREQARLYGPLFHPWTFEIRQDEKVAGRIVKKWSGMLKEGFTDADNFGITFPAGSAAATKALLLGAVFLIDFVHFEKG